MSVAIQADTWLAGKCNKPFLCLLKWWGASMELSWALLNWIKGLMLVWAVSLSNAAFQELSIGSVEIWNMLRDLYCKWTGSKGHLCVSKAVCMSLLLMRVKRKSLWVVAPYHSQVIFAGIFSFGNAYTATMLCYRVLHIIFIMLELFVLSEVPLKSAD